MKKLTLIFILTVFLSCSNSNNNITGKWYSFSKNTGYTEYIIDTIYIKAFGHWGGNFGHRKYSFVKDSINISNYNIIVKKINNGLIILNSKDTLHKLNDTIITYHEINNLSDSIFSQFYKEFYKRAHRSYIKQGYYTQEEYNQSLIDTLLIKEEEEEEEPILKTNYNKELN